MPFESMRPHDPKPMLAILAEVHDALGLPAPILPELPPDPFPTHFDAVLAADQKSGPEGLWLEEIPGILNIGADREPIAGCPVNPYVASLSLANCYFDSPTRPECSNVTLS